MNGNAVLKNVTSVSQSRIGSMGAPKSLSVCDRLSCRRRLCFCSGRSMSDMVSRNCDRSSDVEGHSHMTWTSSSWYISLQFMHVLFSSVTGLLHKRDITNIVFLREVRLHTL